MSSPSVLASQTVSTRTKCKRVQDPKQLKIMPVPTQTSVPHKKRSRCDASPVLHAARDRLVSPSGAGQPGGAVLKGSQASLLYGKLTSDDIAAVLQLHRQYVAFVICFPGDCYSGLFMLLAEMLRRSISVHLFIDDIAEENNRRCARVPTEKGNYVKTLLQSEIGCVDDDRDDPSVSFSPVSRCKAAAISTSLSADVYLEDLGSPPPSICKCKTGCLFTVAGCQPSLSLAIIAEVGKAMESTSFLSSVVKTVIVNKAIHNTTTEAQVLASPTPVVDLTGIDNVTSSSWAAGSIGTKGDEPSLPKSGSCSDMGLPAASSSAASGLGHDDFFAGLDALIGSIAVIDVAIMSPSLKKLNLPAWSLGLSLLLRSFSKLPLPPLTEPEDETLCVMQLELQEDPLVPLYALMPSIGEFRAVVSLGQDPNTFKHPLCISYDEVIQFFSCDTIWSFISYMHFKGHAPYCNLSTMAPGALTSDSKKALYMSRTAVVMIVGVVAACHLFRPACEGGYKVQDPSGGSEPFIEGGVAYHSITVMPFRQLWRRESTMLSLIFKLPYMQSSSMTSVSPEFSTCAFITWEDGPSNKNKVLSPAQRKDTASSSQSPMKLSSAGKDYWHCLGFADDVPIFNGHDFDNLSSMPHYAPSCDLDYFTLVAIGYMPAMWCVKKCPCLNMNVQFVMVLGQAPSLAELANAGYVP
ncbi:hypothetical protein EDD18DRAFT_1108190 [Armillaria luteobubalina]|uniref:Uncharacterized protein n=1 Tax=Armillaria luteobubalina TaxID=153913 RepID=A0AA39UUI3_9AGAR|nr:hypothetical protein EDD18DRAFT_1108190 [Armillaria luteobubalina]